MAWIKKHYTGSTSVFLDNLLDDITDYVTDTAIHGKDAWTLIRSKATPYGTVFKIPNYQENEYGYVALMRDNLRVGSSYWNWLKQPANLGKHFVTHSRGLNLGFNSLFSVDTKGVVSIYGHVGATVLAGVKADGTKIYSANYSSGAAKTLSFSPQPEIFASNADVIFFSMFKQYEDEFEWNDLMGNQRKSIMIKPLKYTRAGSGQTNPNLCDPPLYPGVGSPAIGYSPEFFSTTDDDKRTVYIVKTRHNLMVIIHFCGRWDMASVGFFETFDTQSEYSFPAMTIGGTSGVLPVAELHHYSGGGYGTDVVEEGFYLDYSEKNITFARGVPTFAATWWDKTAKFLDDYMYSQVQAILPNGEWQSFANFGLSQDVYYHKERGYFFQAHKEPARISNSRYFIAPSFSDLSSTVNLLPTSMPNTPDFENNIAGQNKQNYYLEKLYLVQRAEDNINQNMLGMIKNIFWCSSPVTRYGEYVINGKTMLVIPNSWENRKYHFKNYFSVLLGEQQSNERMMAEMTRLERLSKAMNCAIQLDD